MVSPTESTLGLLVETNDLCYNNYEIAVQEQFLAYNEYSRKGKHIVIFIKSFLNIYTMLDR